MPESPLNSRLSELKKCVVIDREGTDLGELIDVTLDREDSFRISHMIIGGGFIEELLEEIQKRANIDEYFSVDDIDHIERREIHLKIKESDLMKTDSDGNLPGNLIKFSRLVRRKVLDPEGNSFGEISDLELKDGVAYIVVTDFQFNRMMNYKHRYGQRIEFVLNTSKLQLNDDSIVYPDSAGNREKLVCELLKPARKGCDVIEIN